MIYESKYFFSKYPAKVAPMWNLTKLLSPFLWICTFVSIFVVFSYFVLSAKVYSIIGFKKDLKYEEIILMPFRFIENKIREVSIRIF